MFETRKQRAKAAASMSPDQFIEWSVKQTKREVVFFRFLYWGTGATLILAWVVASILERP